MEFLIVTVVLGIVTLGVYRLVELFARRKERIMIIEKMQGNVNFDALKNQLNLPFVGKSRNSNWTLRASLLLIGLGVGFIVGLLLQFSLEYQLAANIEAFRMSPHDMLSIIYFASVILFGGIGLLIAYLIERKEERKQA